MAEDLMVEALQEFLHASKRYTDMLEVHMDKLASRQGLGPCEIAVIIALSENPEVTTVTQLSELIRYSKSMVSRSSEGLFRLGLVQATRDRHDHRVIHQALTDKGRALFAAYEEYAAGLRSLVTRGISSDDLAVLQRVCSRISENLDATLIS